MSFAEDLERINTAYHLSVDPAELKGGLKDLGGLLDGGMLNKENAENAEALYCRLYIKFRLAEHVKNLDEKAGAELADYISTEYAAAEKKGYKKTCALMKSAEKFLNVFAPYLKLIRETRLALSSGAELGEAAVEKIEKAKSRAGGVTSPFGGEINFIPAGETLVKEFDKLLKRADERRAAGLEEKTAKVLKYVSEKYLLYEYFPLNDRDGTQADTVVISTPFIEEARLYATRQSEDRRLREIDATALESEREDFSDGIFALLANKKESVLIVNGAKLGERKRLRLFKNAMLAGKKGARAFILDDNGDGKEYSECMSVAVADDRLAPSDVCRSYITVPAFGDVCAELEAKKIINGAADYGVLKSMPFMGFIGLNKVVSAFVAGENWKYTGERISKDNEPAALKYLAVLTSSHLFIDSDWGGWKAGGKREQIADGCDLSDVPAADYEAVNRVFACGRSSFAKCGLIAAYFAEKCAELSRGELESNIKLAVRLIFRIMRLETVPDVEVRDALDNPTAGGLCCGGDKLILFRYQDCKNTAWLRGSLVHECFHAMQFKLRKGGWSEWYYDNFGITRGRVERWALANNVYDSDTGSDMYKVHIVEADAKAFEQDCAEACAECKSAVLG